MKGILFSLFFYKAHVLLFKKKHLLPRLYLWNPTYMPVKDIIAHRIEYKVILLLAVTLFSKLNLKFKVIGVIKLFK